MAWADLKVYVDDVLAQEGNAITDTQLRDNLNRAVGIISETCKPLYYAWTVKTGELVAQAAEGSVQVYLLPQGYIGPPVSVWYDDFSVRYVDPLEFQERYAEDVSSAAGYVYTVQGRFLRTTAPTSALLTIRAFKYLPDYVIGLATPDPMAYLSQRYRFLPGDYVLANFKAGTDVAIEAVRVQRHSRLFAEEIQNCAYETWASTGETYRF